MKKIIYQFFFLLNFLSAAETAAQNIEWTKLFGGSGDDGAESMLITGEGSLVFAGFMSVNTVEDVLLLKTDPDGNITWNRTYNLGMTDWGRALKQASDGGYIIAGMTEVSPQVFDPFLIKTDADGNIEWTHQYDYGFGEDDRGHSVWPTADGGYLLAGQTWLMHGAFGNYDMYLVKTDGDGNVEWKKVYYRENEGNDVALAVQQLTDGGYIVGGFTQSSIWASYILRLDGLGNAVWTNIYPGEWQSECYDIQPVPGGGFIFTGTESSFQTDTDVLITKLDDAGNLEWKNVYGTIDAEQGESIQQLSDGFIISGMSSHGAGGYDMYIVRTDQTGELLWSKTIGGTGDDRAFTMAQVSEGAYVTAGWTWSSGQGLGDVYIVKLTEEVVPVELASFTAVQNGRDIILNWTTSSELNNANFEIQKKSMDLSWVTIGTVNGAGTSQDEHRYTFTDTHIAAGRYLYRLRQVDYNGSFKYSPEEEVLIGEVPAVFSLSQNYPNPFNPSTKINYYIPEPGFIVLKIFDLLGRDVKTLVNENKDSGGYEVVWEGDNDKGQKLSSGTYIYTITSGAFKQTKKMLLIR